MFKIVSSGQVDIVSSGQIDRRTEVDYGGQIIVEAGGTAIAAEIDFNGSAIVSRGGNAVGTVMSGGFLDVYGRTTNTMARGLAYERVWQGGIASGTRLSSGGELDIYFGGKASRTTVGDGGVVFIDGYANGIVVQSGGTIVYEGGRADNVTVRRGAEVIVKVIPSGVTFSGNTIQSGYFPERILSGGVAVATKVLGGKQFVSRGGQATGTVLHGGEQTVYRGGFAQDTRVLGTATQTVSNGGSALNAVVAGALAYQYVFFGGTATGTVISRGVQFVFGTASNTTVSAGGEEDVVGRNRTTGGIAYDTTVLSGGTEAVGSGAAASGIHVAGGGEILLSGGKVDGLSVDTGGKVDVSLFDFSATETASFVANSDSTGGTLTLSDGGRSTSITLFGQYVAAGFQLSADRNGGTVVTYIDPPAATTQPAVAASHVKL